MRLKICKKCGKTFQTKNWHSEVYMCPECSLQAKRESVYRERTCTICGKKFMGYPRSMFCPTCSQARKKAQKKIYNQRKPARHLGSVDICENCGKEYIVNSSVQRFCPDCSKDAIKANIKSRKKIYNDANKAQMYAHKEKMRENGHVCVICGKIFDPSTPTVTCSLECEKELRRRRQNQADIKRGKRALPADARYNPVVSMPKPLILLGF